MKNLDKGYITFIFDDAKMPFTKEVGKLFKEYNIPMSCAVPANKVEKDSELHKALLDIQNNGGEILSHGFSHTAITSPEKCNGCYICTENEIDYELGEAWQYLSGLGFKVNGMIEVGCGGDESTANYDLVEKVAKKYYKYSNASGISPQYSKNRRFMCWDSLEDIFTRINNAAKNKEWIILSAHNYSEISNDFASEDTSTLRKILEYIKSLNGKIEVVIWNYMHNNFNIY